MLCQSCNWGCYLQVHQRQISSVNDEVFIGPKRAHHRRLSSVSAFKIVWEMTFHTGYRSTFFSAYAYTGAVRQAGTSMHLPNYSTILADKPKISILFQIQQFFYVEPIIWAYHGMGAWQLETQRLVHHFSVRRWNGYRKHAKTRTWGFWLHLFCFITALVREV